MSQVIHYGLPEHLAARRTAVRREFAVQWFAAAMALVCLVGAGLLLPVINEERQKRQLVIDPSSLATLPPDIALLGKLGTFRALAIDWAAMRAERLKEDGKVYEALQLHETVCALAPRFPDVWVYAAWNMAYNISVMQYTPEARWQWVQNGIHILRDRGIVYNPSSIKLYKELAWIYWHKIGDYLDDEHFNYKRALAVEMESILGPPPVTFQEQEHFDWFRKIVAAPRDLNAFLKTDAKAGALAETLRGLGLSPDETLLEYVARRIRPELQVDDLIKNIPEDDTPEQRRLRVLRDPANVEALDQLLAAIRSHVLRTRHHLKLDWMMELMENRFGPLDWRNAFAHSLYWSSLGDSLASGNIRNTASDEINNTRFILFSIQNMVTRGRMTLRPDFDNPFRSYIEMTPDTRYIPYLFELYLAYGKKHFGHLPEFREGTAGPNFHVGLVTNMHNWLELLYLEGGDRNREIAEHLFSWLREYNPHPDGRTQEMYLQPLDAFVLNDLRSQMDTYRAANAIIGTFIQQALKQFALGQTDSGVASVKHAVDCYEYWMRDQKKEIKERRKLQPPRLQLRDGIEAFITDPKYDALAKAWLWRGLPLEYKQMVHDRLVPTFRLICDSQNPPWAVERAFPEPPGMAEYRQRAPEPEPEDQRIEEGTRHRG